MKNIIKNIIKKNYKHYLFSNTEFENYKKIKIKYKKAKPSSNLVRKKNIRLFDVEFFLLNRKTQNFNSSDKKKVFTLYKKFEVNNKLKALYDKKFKKKTKKEINKKTYIHLGMQIIRIKEINNLQKLNAILKILDILYIQKDLFLNELEISYLKVLENFKKKTIKKYT